MMHTMLLWAWLLGCPQQAAGPTEPTDAVDPVTQALALPKDLATCAQIDFVEAADICRLEVAQQRARNQDPVGAAAGCAAVEQPLWTEECHFIAAEVLGIRVGLPAALSHCDQAGRYRRFCYIHVAWWAQAFDEIAKPSDPEAGAAVDRFATTMSAIPSAGPRPRWREVVPMLRASAWFGLYYGTGFADPTAARSASEADVESARAGFAWEATRLIAESEGWEDLPAKVAAVWAGKRPPPTGTAFGRECWRGRLPNVTLVEPLAAIPRAHTMHGGLRLVGETPSEDLTIATLEAMFFNPEAPPALWAAWLAAPGHRVRATAARLGTMADARDEAWQQRISSLQDPAIRAQIQSARNQVSKVWQVAPSREGCP